MQSLSAEIRAIRNAQVHLWDMGKGYSELPKVDAGRPKLRLKVQVRLPRDLPISQNEVEVIAALLDDWEMDVPKAQEAAE